MLTHDNLVSGARRVLMNGADVLNFGMVQCIEKNACGISVHDTKTMCNRCHCMNQNCAQWILARDTKVVRARYWRAIQK
jgi:hypothetical protein